MKIFHIMWYSNFLRLRLAENHLSSLPTLSNFDITFTYRFVAISEWLWGCLLRTFVMSIKDVRLSGGWIGIMDKTGLHIIFRGRHIQESRKKNGRRLSMLKVSTCTTLLILKFVVILLTKILLTNLK